MMEKNSVDTTEIDSQFTSDIKTPGALLREAREARKLSQTEIAKQMRLSLRQVKELEKDNYSHIAALTYVRGYLRGYARRVGVSPDKVIAAFNAAALEEAFNRVKAQVEKPAKYQVIPVITRSTRMRMISSKVIRWVTMVVLLILIILVGIWWQGKKHIIGQIHAVISQPEETVPINSTTTIPSASGEKYL